ncbi:UNVERIFIED_CONTAM: Serine/threonine-protein kinase STY13 [Sesamum radiatum]|uniref:non-specific serine/threonine protein kinase n=1 Tax=Sesamum radiatum TaxID=300843 RepID=A0AAW2SKQ6_SESRA
MDAKTSEEGGEVAKGAGDEMLPASKSGILNFPPSDKNPSSTRSSCSINSKDMIFRADKIDLKSLDVQLERHLSRAWSSNLETQQKPKEVWEIDASKLEIRYLVAQGTYGTVYRGTYNGQDVAVCWCINGDFRAENSIEKPSEGYTKLPSRACCVLVEFVPGGTLKNFLFKNRKKKLAFRVVIELALDLSRGLSYLHSKKIVHRDVKAENMLLDYHRTLKIADFGVARVEAQNPRDMTGETGTLGYMAPEVLDGKPYNRKCDVYSFGVCLWETYCCDLPYTDLSFAEVSYAVVKQNLRPEIPRCCPSSLANIMKKCWDANPDKRPDMDEVVRLLEAIDTSKGGGMIPDEGHAGGCFCFAPTRGP